MKDKILLFLKGVLMGICDLIPGISGGTIAFITGIYERLINAVKGFSPKLITSIGNKQEFKKNAKKIDLGFLIILLLGIFVALILGSGLIKYLLENHFIYTMSFFIGLILASSLIIFESIKEHNFKSIIFGILGLIFGIILSFLIPVNVDVTLGYIFFGGFIGVSAMFLPGISGAFILLIIGLYDVIINALHSPLENIKQLLVFFLGAIVGAFVISRVISFLFKKDRCKTLYFLLGLVIGALSIPVKRVFSYPESLEIMNLIVMVCLLLLGILFVLVIRKYGKKYEKELEKIEERVLS
ncbi:MAG: DUF368 domain-containing protein [archaeon]